MLDAAVFPYKSNQNVLRRNIRGKEKGDTERKKQGERKKCRKSKIKKKGSREDGKEERHKYEKEDDKHE
jgi:hypothetical protein